MVTKLWVFDLGIDLMQNLLYVLVTLGVEM